MIKRLMTLGFAAAVLTMLAACDDEGPAERAGAKIDNAVESAGDKLEEAGDKIKEKTQ